MKSSFVPSRSYGPNTFQTPTIRYLYDVVHLMFWGTVFFLTAWMLSPWTGKAAWVIAGLLMLYQTAHRASFLLLVWKARVLLAQMSPHCKAFWHPTDAFQEPAFSAHQALEWHRQALSGRALQILLALALTPWWSWRSWTMSQHLGVWCVKSGGYQLACLGAASERARISCADQEILLPALWKDRVVFHAPL